MFPGTACSAPLTGPTVVTEPLTDGKGTAVTTTGETPTSTPSRAGAGAAAKAAEIARTERPRILLTAVLGAAAGALLGALVGSLLVGLVLAVLGAAAAGLWQRGRGVAARWRMGATGERRTGRTLDRLRRRGWTVLHDRALPTGRANVDHLLVAPDGSVWNVDSKVRTGAARYDARRNYLRIGRASGYQLISSTLYETDRITRALEREVGSVQVHSVLAVHRAKLPAWRNIQLKGVHVVSAKRVRGWLSSRSGLATVRGREVATAAERLFPPYLSR